MNRHDYLYRECRECSCADGECAESKFDRACSIIGAVAGVLLIVFLVIEPWA